MNTFRRSGTSFVVATADKSAKTESVMAPEDFEVGEFTLPKTPGESVFKADFLSRARGCFLGQLCGDALGSMVEFYSEKQIKGMYPDGLKKMKNGGRWESCAGQPTDDSEMAIMLTAALITEGKYDVIAVLKNYLHWINSNPIGVGRTTARALVSARSALNSGMSDQEIVAYIEEHGGSPDSQANGALMRISPLAIFGYAMPANHLASIAMMDANLTHINTVCHECNAAYVVAIQALLNGATVGEGYNAAKNWLTSYGRSKPVLESLEAAATEPPKEFQRNMGWVLIAFQNAFYHLLHTESATDAIVETVNHGGDADTTGSIVGALMGAAKGIESLDPQWIKCVLNCKPEPGSYTKKPRPKEFWPIDALIYVDKLLVFGTSYMNSDRS